MRAKKEVLTSNIQPAINLIDIKIGLPVIRYSPSSSIYTAPVSDSSYPVNQILTYSKTIMIRNIQNLKKKPVLVSKIQHSHFLIGPHRSHLCQGNFDAVVQVHQAGE